MAWILLFSSQVKKITIHNLPSLSWRHQHVAYLRHFNPSKEIISADLRLKTLPFNDNLMDMTTPNWLPVFFNGLI